MTAPLAYRRDVDGLRAVAVLAVLGYHAGFGVSGGYIGVDVFFVISGFLITSLVLRDLLRNEFSIVEFWERRVRRIVPAVAFMCLGSLCAGYFILGPDDFLDMGRSVWAQVAISSNILFWRESGYFQSDAEFIPLLHTWSLSLEEQFYLVFPLFLYLVYRLWPKRLIAACVAVALVSLAAGVVGAWKHPTAAFYLLPPRAWELLVGGILAMHLRVHSSPSAPSTPQGRWHEYVAGFGFLAVVVPIFMYDERTVFPGLTAIPPVVGTALVIWSNSQGQTFISRILSWRPVVYVGLISYSLYLWHWPIIVFLRHWYVEDLPATARLAVIPASFLLAAFSTRFVETPFRRRSICASRRSIFAFAGTAAAFLVAAALPAVTTAGLPSRFGPEVQAMLISPEDKRLAPSTSLEQIVSGRMPIVGGQREQSEDRENLDLLLWGDSHAQVLIPLVEQVSRQFGLRTGIAAKGGIKPLLNWEGSNQRQGLRELSIPWNQGVFEFIREHTPRNVLIVANWRIQSDQGRFLESLRSTIEELRRLGTTVWVLRSIPTFDSDIPRLLLRETRAKRDPSMLGITKEGYREQTRLQDAAFAMLDRATVHVLDPEPYMFAQSDRSLVVLNGEPVYFDHNHLTSAGLELLRPLLQQAFAAISVNSGVIQPAAVTPP